MKTRTKLLITNLPGGFVRLWLISSVAWIVGVSIDIGAAAIYLNSNSPNPFEQSYPELFVVPSLFTEALWLGGLLIGPPVALLVMGGMLGRAIKRSHY
jgi:hypothetical protein